MREPRFFNAPHHARREEKRRLGKQAAFRAAQILDNRLSKDSFGRRIRRVFSSKIASRRREQEYRRISIRRLEPIPRFAPAARVSRYSRSLAVSISQRPLASHERILQQICDGIYRRDIPGRASAGLHRKSYEIGLRVNRGLL